MTRPDRNAGARLFSSASAAATATVLLLSSCGGAVEAPPHPAERTADRPEAPAGPVVLINEAEFRDRVYACWLGKNIGGTLGMPYEGRRETHDLTFYTHLKPGVPAANDDLDLQILWLKAMEENAGVVNARILGEYWLKYIPVNWNEYGVGKRNMRRGFLPPVSGAFGNDRWKHSNGAWIRSEIWACLAPGAPALAARMAREDACVDHGQAEGTAAEIFTAAVESAAWIERDRDRLIAIGLSMIPEDSGLARAIRAVMDAHASGKTWREAREIVVRATEETGWFQAPRNVAFTVLGWLYGEGDFGRSICIAVNCGDDTDCTGATLGSIFGIIGGTKAIPEKWSAPIGKSIRTVAISGFKAAADLDELTDRTVAMAKRVMEMHDLPVRLTEGPTDVTRAGELTLADPAAARALIGLSPWVVDWREEGARVSLDYRGEPYVKPLEARALGLTIGNTGEVAFAARVKLDGLPGGWRAEGLPAEPVRVAPSESRSLELAVTAPEVEEGDHRMAFVISAGLGAIRVPLTLVGKVGVGADDLALASGGSTAVADGEYANERGCTSEAIDGVIATPQDFSNRWHSSLETPHPHWIEVRLAAPARVGRAIVRFADPAGHPTSFRGLVRKKGARELAEVFERTGYADRRSFRADLGGVEIEAFRFEIRASANPAYPNAAQVSEIELYPPKE